jgi:hypothetical protein
MAIKGVLLSTKEGKLLFYRNYSQMEHSLFEDFAFSLPQKIKVENQHTFSNHGNNRLIYLPLESLLIVLVTSKESNIIEDIETVNMMKEILYTVLQQKNNEEGVYEHYVDLAFSFDDMINLQTRNSVNQNQILALLEMDSNNEKLHNNMMLERENEQKKKTEAEFVKLEKSKKIQSIIDSELQSIDKSLKDFSLKNKIDFVKVEEDVKDNEIFEHKRDIDLEQKKAPQIKGMKLGGAKNKPKNLSNMFDFKKQKNQNERKDSRDVEETKKEFIEENKNTYNPLGEEVEFTISEKMSAKINEEGEYSFFDLKGTFFIYIKNPNLERFTIKVHKKEEKHLPLKLPPNFEKKLWKNNILALKPKASSLQKDTLIETLKYNLTFTDIESTKPFNISFWFSGKEFSSEIEFNEDQKIFKEVKNLKIVFKKLKNASTYRVKDTENSAIVKKEEAMEWVIDNLDQDNNNASFILEFQREISGDDVFPALITINSELVLLQLDVLACEDETGRQVRFAFKKQLTDKDFVVGEE